MPHLSKLAKTYKDKVTVIGLSDESVEKVEEFLGKKSNFGDATWGEAMAFTVATDPDKSVKNDIFKAAGGRGIPTSFIIADNKMQWMGHPSSIDKPLQMVVEGKWSRETAQKLKDEAAALNRIMGQLRGLYQDAMQSDDWSDLLDVLNEGTEQFPDSVQLHMTKWQILLLNAHQDKAAYALGHKVVKMVWDDSQSLNQIAWTVVDDKAVKTRDLAFAMKAAQRANELTDSKNAAILDTLARVYYEKKELKEALKWQRLAVKYADAQMAGDLQKALEKYEAEAKKKQARF